MVRKNIKRKEPATLTLLGPKISHLNDHSVCFLPKTLETTLSLRFFPLNLLSANFNGPETKLTVLLRGFGTEWDRKRDLGPKSDLGPKYFFAPCVHGPKERQRPYGPEPETNRTVL